HTDITQRICYRRKPCAAAATAAAVAPVLAAVAAVVATAAVAAAAATHSCVFDVESLWACASCCARTCSLRPVDCSIKPGRLRYIRTHTHAGARAFCQARASGNSSAANANAYTYSLSRISVPGCSARELSCRIFWHELSLFTVGNDTATADDHGQRGPSSFTLSQNLKRLGCTERGASVLMRTQYISATPREPSAAENEGTACYTSYLYNERKIVSQQSLKPTRTRNSGDICMEISPASEDLGQAPASNATNFESQANRLNTIAAATPDASMQHSGRSSDFSQSGEQANSTASFIELAQSFKALTDSMNSVIISFKEKLVGEVTAPSTPLVQFDAPPVIPQPHRSSAASAPIRPNLQVNSIGVAEPSAAQSLPRSRISSLSYPPFSELPSDPFDLLDREIYPSLDSPIVGPVALKPALKSFHFPSFWKHSPELWLDTIEENFRLIGVTSDHEKYIHTMSSLGGDVIAEIANAARNLPKPDTAVYTLAFRYTIGLFTELKLHLQNLTLHCHTRKIYTQKHLMFPFSPRAHGVQRLLFFSRNRAKMCMNVAIKRLQTNADVILFLFQLGAGSAALAHQLYYYHYHYSLCRMHDARRGNHSNRLAINGIVSCELPLLCCTAPKPF
ncbi:unnamed protein product, partial [Trichogramma brassicae]